MNLTSSFSLLAAVSLVFQPTGSQDGSPPSCSAELRPMDPDAFSRLTGIIVAPRADIRIDFDGDCETTEVDVLRWLGGEAARPFLDRRDARFMSYADNPFGWVVCWDDAIVGDVNVDDVVDHADLVALTLQLGERSEHATSPAVDVSGNGIIDLDDLAQLLERWGELGSGLSWCQSMSYCPQLPTGEMPLDET